MLFPIDAQLARQRHEELVKAALRDREFKRNATHTTNVLAEFFAALKQVFASRPAAPARRSQVNARMRQPLTR